MADVPLTKDRAKVKLNRCLEEGTVVYSLHFRDELLNDDLTIEDVLTICRAGVIVTAPEPDIRNAKMKRKSHECTNCGEGVTPGRRNYRYSESGISNVILQGLDVTDCPKCHNVEVTIPRMTKIHRAIALALANYPARLTGEHLRFLRTHLGMSGEQLGRYLHTDKTKISKWERGEDPIGPATDRLIRLLAAVLDSDLRAEVARIARHLPDISDEPGKAWEIHIDVETLQASFLATFRAA